MCKAKCLDRICSLSCAREMGEALIHAAEIVETTGETACIIKVGSGATCLIAIGKGSERSSNCVAIVGVDGIEFPECA